MKKKCKNSDILNIEMNPIRHDKKVMPDENGGKYESRQTGADRRL